MYQYVTFLLSNLPTYLLPTYLPTSIPPLTSTYLHLPPPTSTYLHLPTYLPTYLPACLPACLPAYLPTCLPAYLPTCLPACLPAYLPTYPQKPAQNNLNPKPGTLTGSNLDLTPTSSHSSPPLPQLLSSPCQDSRFRA